MTSKFFELLPGLWIGDKNSSNDYNLFKKNNIKCTINCENDLKFLLNQNNQYEFNVLNTEINQKKTIKYLNDCADFINNNLDKLNNILVFCNSGLQFAPTVVIAFLIKYSKVNKITAINYLISKNESIFRDLVLLDNSLNLFSKIYSV